MKKSKISKKLLPFVMSFVFYFGISLPAFAASAPVPPADQAGKTVILNNPISTSDIPTLAGNIIKALLGIIGSIALLMVVYGGFLWLTSAGNPERIKEGKGTLVWAAIGLAFIFSSYIIAQFVFKALLGTK